MNRKTLLGTALVAVTVSAISVLSLHRSTDAAQQGARAPFGNSVEQRSNMIKELRAIKVLLKEQNALLRAAAAKEKKPDDSKQR